MKPLEATPIDSGYQLLLYGEFGPAWLDRIEAKSVADALAGIDRQAALTVGINTRGGSSHEAHAIYNLFKDWPGHVHMRIDGLAASAGSVVIMAGDEISIAENGYVMTHESSAATEGTAAELRDTANILEQLDQTTIALYAARTGNTPDELAAWMRSSTWMSAAQALERKFVDRINPNKAVRPPVSPEQFAKLPDPIRAEMERWRVPEVQQKAESMTTPAPAAPAVPPASSAGTPAPTTTAATPAPAAVNPQQAAPNVTELIAAERKRGADITAACQMAGCPDRAAKYIEDGVAVEAVQAQLLTFVCQQRQPVGGDGTGAGTAGGAGQSADPDQALKAEYRQNAALYAQQGLDEKSFLEVRRFELGQKPSFYAK